MHGLCVLWWVQQKHVSVAAVAAIPGAGDLLVTVLGAAEGCVLPVLVQVRHAAAHGRRDRRSVSGFGPGGVLGAEHRKRRACPGALFRVAGLPPPLSSGRPNDDTRLFIQSRTLRNQPIQREGCTNSLFATDDPNDAVRGKRRIRGCLVALEAYRGYRLT